MEKTNKKIGVVKMTNQKWKNYEPDKKMVELFLALEISKKKLKKQQFIEWLNKDIYVNNDEDSHKLQIKTVLEELIKETMDLVKGYRLTIGNEKELRDNIATMIYKRSEDGK